jgi:tRNA (mo5U34)-methyltransferase
MKHNIDRCAINDGVVTIDGWSEGGPPDALIYIGEEATSRSFTVDRPDVAEAYGPLAKHWGFRISAIVSTSAIDETKITLKFGRPDAIEVPLLTYGASRDSRQIGFTFPSDAVFEDACRTLSWFHSVPFGAGRYTPGHKKLDQMNREARNWKFPPDLTGKTMLDIGCADGGWSVHGLLRGAASVTSIDVQQTGGRKYLQDKKLFPINFMTVDLFSHEFDTIEPADFVLFAGVLYHVHDPVEALKRLRRVTREFAILETLVDERLGSAVPYAMFYENDELAGDKTNWFGPNRACLEAWIRVAGFKFTLTDVVYSGTLGRVSYLLFPNM